MNTFQSLVVSMVAGVSFVSLVIFAPSQSERINSYSQKPLQSKIVEKNSPFREAIQKERNQGYPQDTQTRPQPYSVLNLKIDTYTIEEALKEKTQSNGKIRTLLSQPLSQVFHRGKFTDPYYLPPHRLDINLRTFQWGEESQNLNLEVGYLGNGFEFEQNLRSVHWAKFYRSPFLSHHPTRLNYVDLQVPVSNSVSAIFTASDDTSIHTNSSLPLRNYVLVGFQYDKGESFSTRILAGDTNLPNAYLVSNLSQPNPMGFTTPQEFRRMGLGENNEFSQRALEWQANFQPSRSLKLQTAFINHPQGNPNIRENSRTSLAGDYGRLAMFWGQKYVLFNLSYDYQLNDQNFRSMMTQWQPQNDIASLGFLFYLNPSQSYSLYLGGNQFNLAANRTNLANSSTAQPTFKATLRGKAREGGNFFLNFQNQPLGFWGVGLPIPMGPIPMDKASLEYATSLGLELNF